MPMIKGEGGSFDLTITRIFDAPRALVFRQWCKPEHVKAWFAPQGFSVTRCEFEPKEGAPWRVDYHSGESACSESGRFLEVNEPHRLVFTLTQRESGTIGPETLVVVTFEEDRGGTRMLFRQTGFDSGLRRDDHVEGWGECFDKLKAHLELLAAEG